MSRFRFRGLGNEAAMSAASPRVNSMADLEKYVLEAASIP